MPRLRRRRKTRTSDFGRSLTRFLADPLRKLWVYGSRYIAVRTADGDALLKDREAGTIQRAVLRQGGSAGPAKPSLK